MLPRRTILPNPVVIAASYVIHSMQEALDRVRANSQEGLRPPVIKLQKILNEAKHGAHSRGVKSVYTGYLAAKDAYQWLCGHAQSTLQLLSWPPPWLAPGEPDWALRDQHHVKVTNKVVLFTRSSF